MLCVMEWVITVHGHPRALILALTKARMRLPISHQY